MQRVPHFFWASLPRLLFAGGIVFVGFVVLGEGMCGNSVVQEATSPGKQAKAIVFQRDCGATTGFTTHVSVIGTGGSLPNKGGNLLVVDTDNGVAPRGPHGGPTVSIEWQEEGLLVVRHHPAVRKHRQEYELEGVRVRYERDW